MVIILYIVILFCIIIFQVWPKVIRKNIERELPFMATESVLMACVKAGGNRQTLHEILRVHSMAARKIVSQAGEENDLIERILSDVMFAAVHNQLTVLLDPMRFIGRAPQQVDEFLEEVVDPLLSRHQIPTATLDAITI